jgi:hypothetical protein
MSKKTEAKKHDLPYLIADLVMENCEMIRMPRRPCETPEFRLGLGKMGRVVKEIRKLIKEAHE